MLGKEYPIYESLRQDEGYISTFSVIYLSLARSSASHMAKVVLPLQMRAERYLNYESYARLRAKVDFKHYVSVSSLKFSFTYCQK